MSLIEDLRITTNKVIAEKKKEAARLNATEAKKQEELAGIPKAIRPIISGIMTELKMEAEDGKRKCVVRRLAAWDFSKGTELKKISSKSELRGEAKALRDYLERQGLKCTVRRIKKQLAHGGICGVSTFWQVYAELIVRW